MVQGKLGSKQENLNKIEELANYGKNLSEIANELELSIGTIRGYAYNEGIKLPRVRPSRERRIEQIKQSIVNGANYAEDVAEQVGISIHTIRIFAYDNKLKLPPYRNQRSRYSRHPKKDPRKDELIRKGLTLGAISEEYGKLHNTRKVSRERIRQYILSTDQHEIWEKAKEQRNIEVKERSKLINILSTQLECIGSYLVSQIETAGLRNASEEEKLAYEKTREYFANKKLDRGAYTFDNVSSLFQDYYNAFKNNEKVSIMTLGKNNSIYFIAVGCILKKVGLKPLVHPNHKKRVPTPKHKKQALERAVEVEMPNLDIAYFLRVPDYIVSNYFSNCYKGDKKRPKVENYINRFGIEKKGALHHRTASQIYESRDFGFSTDEILELCEVNKEVYDYTMKHKREISSHIKKSLRVMFPDKRIRKPYITFSF